MNKMKKFEKPISRLEFDQLKAVRNGLHLVAADAPTRAIREHLTAMEIILRDILRARGTLPVSGKCKKDGIEHEWPDDRREQWEAIK